MLRELSAAARRNVSLFEATLTLLFLGVVYAVTDDPAVTLGIFAGFLLVVAFERAQSLPAVDERWLKAALGVFAAACGGAMLWLARPLSGLDPALPSVFVLCGAWLLLDARADFAQGRRREALDRDDIGSGEAMLVMQHLRLVADELEDGPKTVPELADACDLTEPRVRQAIEVVRDDGTVYPVDGDADRPRYALDERKVGLSGLGWQAAGGLRGLVRRLLRPLRP